MRSLKYRISIAFILLIVLIFFVYYNGIANHRHYENIIFADKTAESNKFSFKKNKLQRHDIFKLRFTKKTHISKQSHAISVVNLDNGFFYAVFFSGSGEAKPDVGLYSALFDTHAEKWDEPRMIMDKYKVASDTGFFTNTLGNPSLLYANNKLYLFFSSVSFGGWASAKLNVVISNDMGKTWGKVQRLSLSPFLNTSFNARRQAYMLDNGQILLPVYFELGILYSSYLILEDKENLVSVKFNRRLTSINFSAEQPELIRTKNKVVVLSRTSNTKNQFIVQTNLIKNKASETYFIKNLVSPDASLAAKEITDNLWLLAFNNTKDRREIHLAFSSDYGKTWRAFKVLDKGKKLGYPAILNDKQGNIHIFYTSNRKLFKHHLISYTQLLQWLK